MIRKHYRDSIDIVASEQLAKITVGRAIAVAILLVDYVTRSIAMNSVNVAYGNYLHIVSSQKTLQVNGSLATRPLAAHTDTAHRNSVARCNTAGFAQGRRGNDGRETCSSQSNTSCLSQEITAIHLQLLCDGSSQRRALRMAPILSSATWSLIRHPLEIRPRIVPAEGFPEKGQNDDYYDLTTAVPHQDRPSGHW
jgi:hypothetical protein